MYRAPVEDMAFLIDEVIDLAGRLGDVPRFAELGAVPNIQITYGDDGGETVEEEELPIHEDEFDGELTGVSEGLDSKLDALVAEAARKGGARS